MYEPVNIHGIFLDPITERPILLLKHTADNRILPIWIGAAEANAIALQLEHVKVPRPMTHDLMCGILDQLASPIEKVLICDLQDNTYFAQIQIKRDQAELLVDARPSDAVALAIRVGAPIFVRDDIFDRAGQTEEKEESAEQLSKWLENLNPEDLGHYEM
ncbi:MAG: bifunctional nuclease family protein [Acidobacteriota bacterium]|jgi:uncharacterized protein